MTLFKGIKWLALLLPLSLGLSGCAQDKTFDEMVDRLITRSIPLVLPEDCSDDSSCVFLDAREFREYEVSHIMSAVPVGYKDFSLDSLVGIPSDAHIVVYCSVGYRSEKIGEKLKKAGYEHVSNLYGGIFHWVNTGNTVYQNGEATDQVHAYSKKWGQWLEEEACEKVFE